MRALDLHNPIMPASRKQTKSAASSRAKSILEAFEHIVELAEKSNLDEDFFDKAASYIRYASRKLKLTAMQTVLLSLFVDRSEDNRIMLSELARYVGCRTTKILRLANDVEVLEARHYVRVSRSQRTMSFRVPPEVLLALRNNQPYVRILEPISDTLGFFDRFNRLMREKNNDELTYDSLMEQTEELLEEVKTSTFATELSRCDLDDDDRLLFIFMAHLFVENNDDNIRFSDLDNLYDNEELPIWTKRQLLTRHSDLFVEKLIENVNEDGMARSEAFKLTESAKERMLSELNIYQKGRSDSDLIKADTLAEKKLFYNPSERDQIDELTEILGEGRFLQVQTRLREAGMRPGFCCMFYGSPGTGKTETVYQIARRTGRSIMRVDVDKIKSCWVGESEKNIKALFDRYRSICKNTNLAPILLFNEADAVLGVRMEGASRAVDKMENSIQNIILQEMETIEGIMIATTNLTSNLDKAFERRFLYKVRFDKPSVEARSLIWQSMLRGLDEEHADLLASKFDLSGGEIENIARKYSVSAILSGRDAIDIDEIITDCLNERIDGPSRPKIGF